MSGRPAAGRSFPAPAGPGTLRGTENMERTLILLKPDCVQRRLVGTILARFEQKGLRLAGMKLLRPERSMAETHYEVHKERPFYPSLLSFLTSGPTLALVLEGREAVAVARTLIGKTDPVESPPGTIRGDYAISKQNNLIHGSDSVENARKEIALWFGASELVDFTPADAAWVTGQ